MQDVLRVDLRQIESPQLEENVDVHCENPIGSTQIPIGVAGPLSVTGLATQGEYFLPIATTEGALIASISRGIKAINESGGAVTSYENKGITRGPVFFTGSLKNSNQLVAWIENNNALLAKTAEATSSHLTFNNAFVKKMTDHVFIRFSYDTSDAMGMNMVTIATQAIVDLIAKKTGFKSLSVAANFDIDKKPSQMNSLLGRGYKAWGEVELTDTVIKEILKTDIQSLYDTWIAKCMYGSYLSGSLGYNAQFANVIAGLYLATGQDPAHIVEGSHGITTMRIVNSKKLYVSVYLPAVVVGLVGGGTKLPSQQSALSILKFRSKKKKGEFTEVIAAAVLAGEISLLSAQASHHLASAHASLGRSRK